MHARLTRLLLAEALHTRDGSHGVDGEGVCCRGRWKRVDREFPHCSDSPELPFGAGFA